MSLVKGLGISVPPSGFFRGSPGRDQRVPLERFPVVVKPARRRGPDGNRKVAVRYASTPAQLEKVVGSLGPEAGPFLIQARVAGRWSGRSLLRWNGRVWQALRIAGFARSRPPVASASAVRACRFPPLSWPIPPRCWMRSTGTAWLWSSTSTTLDPAGTISWRSTPGSGVRCNWPSTPAWTSPGTCPGGVGPAGRSQLRMEGRCAEPLVLGGHRPPDRPAATFPGGLGSARRRAGGAEHGASRARPLAAPPARRRVPPFGPDSRSP